MERFVNFKQIVRYKFNTWNQSIYAHHTLFLQIKFAVSKSQSWTLFGSYFSLKNCVFNFDKKAIEKGDTNPHTHTNLTF